MLTCPKIQAQVLTNKGAETSQDLQQKQIMCRKYLPVFSFASWSSSARLLSMSSACWRPWQSSQRIKAPRVAASRVPSMSTLITWTYCHRLDSLLFSGTWLCHHFEIDSLHTGEDDVGGISAPLKSFWMGLDFLIVSPKICKTPFLWLYFRSLQERYLCIFLYEVEHNTSLVGWMPVLGAYSGYCLKRPDTEAFPLEDASVSLAPIHITHIDHRHPEGTGRHDGAPWDSSQTDRFQGLRGDSEATEKIGWVLFFQAVLMSRNKTLFIWSHLPPLWRGNS